MATNDLAGLVFQPRDVLLFRDSREFTIGGTAYATAPPPSVFYGAIRHQLIAGSGVEFNSYLDDKTQDQDVLTLRERIGSPDEMGSLLVRGPFLYDDGAWFFPPPANRFADGNIAVPAELATDELTDLGDLLPMSNPRIPNTAVAEQWLNSAALQTYLLEHACPDSEANTFRAEKRLDLRGRRKHLSELFLTELRFGHRRDPTTLVPSEGYLFSMEMQRPCQRVAAGQLHTCSWGAVVDARTAEDAAPTSGRLGGRGHRCDLYKVSAPDCDTDELKKTLVDAAEKSDGCFLYLATPAIFDRGWRPREWEGLTLRAAAMHRPGVAAGWDMATNRPRPISRTVQAGSVYFFAGKPQTGWRTFVEETHFRSISDARPEAGFGLALVGAWTPSGAEAKQGGKK